MSTNPTQQLSESLDALSKQPNNVSHLENLQEALSQIRKIAQEQTENQEQQNELDVATLVQILHETGMNLFQFGLKTEGMDLLKESLKLCREKVYCGADNQEIATILNNIGELLLSDQENTNTNVAALKYLEEALAITKRLSTTTSSSSSSKNNNNNTNNEKTETVEEDSDKLATCYLNVGDVKMQLAGSNEENAQQGLKYLEIAVAMKRRLCKGQDDMKLVDMIDTLGYYLEKNEQRRRDGLLLLVEGVEMRKRLDRN